MRLNVIFKSILIFFGLLLSQQAFSNCNFALTDSTLYSIGSEYKVRISFKNACSNNMVLKRKLTSPSLDIFKGDKHVSSLQFGEGYWLESTKKFHFKNKISSNGCKDLKSATLDLNKHYVTSLSGNYLNLNKETGKTWKCSTPL